MIAAFGPKLVNENLKDLANFDLHRKQSLVASGSSSGHIAVLDIKNSEVIA